MITYIVGECRKFLIFLFAPINTTLKSIYYQFIIPGYSNMSFVYKKTIALYKKITINTITSKMDFIFLNDWIDTNHVKLKHHPMNSNI
jgi:hypothetical protein